MLNRIKFILLSAFVVISFSMETQAQDPEFSQYFAAPLHVNPALAGISFGPRININYRNEWPGIDNAYATYAVSYDQHFEKISGGVGVSLLADQVAGGLLNTYRAGLMYSYLLSLSDNFGVKIGAEAGVIYKTIDRQKFVFGDQIEPGNISNVLPLTNETEFDDNKIYPDFSAGIVGFTNIFYAGVGVKHLSQPNESFRDSDEEGARLPLRTAAHVGASFKLTRQRDKNYFFSPNALFVQQGKFTQLNVGSYVQLGWIFGGAWFRHTIENSDAVIGLLGISYEFVRIGYSYDVTVSELSGHSGGSHEVSLTLIFGEDNPLQPSGKAGMMKCPVFLY